MALATFDSSTEAVLLTCESQISDVQSLSGQLLDILAEENSQERYQQQILRVSDSLQASATSAEAAYERVTDTLNSLNQSQPVSFEQQRDRAMKELQNDQQTAVPHGASCRSLRGITQLVQDTGGVMVECVPQDDDPGFLQRQPAPVSKASVSETAVEVRMLVPGVFRASVALCGSPGNPDPCTVAVFSTCESSDDKDAWSASDHLVFRRVSALAVRALAAFQQQAAAKGQPAGVALLKLLLWLCTYRHLFSRRCEATGMLLAADVGSQSMLPPLHRSFRSLSIQELLSAAAKSCPAFHVHATPGGLL